MRGENTLIAAQLSLSVNTAEPICFPRWQLPVSLVDGVAQVCGDRNGDTVAVAAVLRLTVVLLWREIATDRHCVTSPL